LQEDVAARDQARRGQAHDALLTDDDAMDVLLDDAEQLLRAPRL
jgi:hypothetical protein